MTTDKLQDAIDEVCFRTRWAKNVALKRAVHRIISAAGSADTTWIKTPDGVKHPGISVTFTRTRRQLLRFFPTQNKLEIAPRSLSKNSKLREMAEASLAQLGIADLKSAVVRVELDDWSSKQHTDALDRAVRRIRRAMVVTYALG